ncbi:unnamed protein product, partial [Iphiclides podalirius]
MLSKFNPSAYPHKRTLADSGRYTRVESSRLRVRSGATGARVLAIANRTLARSRKHGLMLHGAGGLHASVRNRRTRLYALSGAAATGGAA